MDIATVQENVRGIIKEIDREKFIYQLLLAYGKPKASITRLEKGSLNLAKSPGEVVWKKNLWFKGIECASHTNPAPAGLVRESSTSQYDLHALADQLRKSEQVTKYGLRFVVVTDYTTLLAVDTKTAETLDISISDLDKHSHFFLPWAGLEKHLAQNESLADIKAAYRMAKLYDQITKDNPSLDAFGTHALNVFLSRLLFCFFAEDTEIFPNKGMFTSAIASHTNEDGSDLDAYLNKLFDVMNTEIRKDYPAFLDAFPYVNGGLLAEKLAAPKFSRHSRKIIIECGELDWSEINPDIFGSMMQAVVHTDERSETGMHYTSVSNIMKVIEPLFLADLRDEFENNFDNPKGLERLRTRLSNIKIFDPACGSGNFLIIAFKELRKLEMEIYLRLRELNPNYQTFFTLPQIKLTNFFGLDVDDFAHEIATLSLWLAEHQMNVKFKQNLGILVPPLPLKPGGHIACENATQADWNEVCPVSDKDEVYVLGNPPYVGYSMQSDAQKADMANVFKGIDGYKNLDYIACWFYSGARFIAGTNHKLAFVTTNSLCQGEQVALLWPHVFSKNLEISFAHKEFKWNNNAKHNAGITCSIVGLGAVSDAPKQLFLDDRVQQVKQINAYLANADNVVVRKQPAPISDLPQMLRGSSPVDDGNLILDHAEYAKIIGAYPQASRYLKKLIGSKEFINGYTRWCIWVNTDELAEALQIRPLAERFERVKKFRLESKKAATRELAAVPHRFGEIRYVSGNSIIVPRVSSERRDYIPMGFLTEDHVITDLAFGIYEPEPWAFAILSSRMHNSWVRAVSGRMRTDIRYSVRLCYNTFALPVLSNKQKDDLTSHAFNIISEREKHPEKTMADLYDPTKMPSGLLQAHRDLDVGVDRCYRSRDFQSDIERLEVLFRLYQDMSKSNLREDCDDEQDGEDA